MITQLAPLFPLIILGIGTIFLLMFEVFLPSKELARGPSDHPQLSTVGVRENIILYSLVFALFGLLFRIEDRASGITLFSGQIFQDPLSWYLSFFIVLATILTLLIGMARLTLEGIYARGEFYALMLMTVMGALIFVAAAELVTLFIGLETLSLGLYCLCGSCISGQGPAMRRSSESALKYFLLGSFSSAFMLYGIALLYGITGTTEIPALVQNASAGNPPIMYFAMGLLLVGAIFKLGAVPFHFWAPDVYQGAPTMVTLFMASVVKIAAMGVLVRLFWQVFHHEIIFWSGIVWTISIATMVLGNCVALRQRSMKRMLAYSSIAHAGYLMMGLLAPGESYGGGAAILFYIVVYTMMTLGAFGVVLGVTAEHSDGPHPDDVARFNGLGFRRPYLAALMTLFMLSLAGLPPGLAGLIGKFYLFSSVLNAGYLGIVIIGALASAVSCYYYLRVIVAMYFVQSDHDHDDTLPLGMSLVGALTICGAAVVLLGIFPDLLHRGAAAVMQGW